MGLDEKKSFDIYSNEIFSNDVREVFTTKARDLGKLVDRMTEHEPIDRPEMHCIISNLRKIYYQERLKKYNKHQIKTLGEKLACSTNGQFDKQRMIKAIVDKYFSHIIAARNKVTQLYKKADIDKLDTIVWHGCEQSNPLQELHTVYTTYDKLYKNQRILNTWGASYRTKKLAYNQRLLQSASAKKDPDKYAKASIRNIEKMHKYLTESITYTVQTLEKNIQEFGDYDNALAGLRNLSRKENKLEHYRDYTKYLNQFHQCLWYCDKLANRDAQTVDMQKDLKIKCENQDRSVIEDIKNNLKGLKELHNRYRDLPYYELKAI